MYDKAWIIILDSELNSVDMEHYDLQRQKGYEKQRKECCVVYCDG